MNIAEELSINTDNRNVLKRFELNIDYKDSLVQIVNQMYQHSDELFQANDESHLSILVLTGAWAESFYILNKLYAKTLQPELFSIIVYQSDVVESLVKLLSPYYEHSPEFTQLLDCLVKIAYEFDVMDRVPRKTTVITDSAHQVSYIDNKVEFKFTGSKPDSLLYYATELRKLILK